MKVKAHLTIEPDMDIRNLDAGDVFRFVNSTEVLMKLDTSQYNPNRPRISEKNPVNQAVILTSGKTLCFPSDSPKLYRRVIRQVPSLIIDGALLFEDELPVE